MNVPLARTQDGAVLGVDQRRLRGMIPGLIAAQFLLPGDRIDGAGQELLVLTVTPSRLIRGSVHVTTRIDGGAEISLERSADEPVMVRTAGEFDR